MTKIGLIARNNRRFFFESSDAKMDVDSFSCFDVIFLEKKACDAIAIPEKRYQLCHSNLKIAHMTWIFSKYDIMQIR